MTEQEHIHAFEGCAQDSKCTTCGQTMEQVFGKGSKLHPEIGAAARENARWSTGPWVIGETELPGDGDGDGDGEG